jgi:hypothetical protein
MGWSAIELETRRFHAIAGACTTIILEECERDQNWWLAVASSMYLYARIGALVGMSDADIRQALTDYLASGEHRHDLPAAAGRTGTPQ